MNRIVSFVSLLDDADRLKDRRSRLWHDLKLLAIVSVAAAFAAMVVSPALHLVVFEEVAKSRRVRWDALAVALCPRVFALWWAAECASLLYGRRLDALLFKGRFCFSWGRATKLPTALCADAWAKGLRKTCAKPARAVVAGLILAGFLQLLFYALTLRGAVGIACWSIGIRDRRSSSSSSSCGRKKKDASSSDVSSNSNESSFTIQKHPVHELGMTTGELEVYDLMNEF